MTKHPKRLPPEYDEKPVRIVLSMTCDRLCRADSGTMVHPGTKVTYLGHLPGQAVKVRMEDGSEEVVHPHCFPELR